MNKTFQLIGSALIAAFAVSATTAVVAQSKEQFVPVLSYRTGPYAPNGTPWANGFVDYLKLVNAKGGINGVKISYEECETGYDTARSVECYERLKSKNPSFVQTLSTGATFAITEKAPGDKIPVLTVGYGRSESADGAVFKWNFPIAGTYWDCTWCGTKSDLVASASSPPRLCGAVGLGCDELHRHQRSTGHRLRA